MAKTNLLYVITKLELGGAQTQLLSLIRNLDTSQYNISLFTAHDGILIPDALAISGLNVHRSRFLERSINPVLDIPAFFELVSFIKQNQIRIVHTHSSKAGILGRLAAAVAGVQGIYHTVHGWSFHPYQHFFVRAVYVFFERIAACVTKKIIVVCRADKERGMRAGIGRADSYEVIPYAIDARAFGITDPFIRQELGIASDALVVGTVACFKPQKAPLDYLALARIIVDKMPGVVFVMAGDGSLRRVIERFIGKHGLEKNVILAGWRRDIPRVLAAFDVFVLTSYWEGLPISVMEAMASSLPVVATHTGGIAEIINEPRTGYLCACGDLDALSNRVLRLLHDKGLRKSVGANACKSLMPGFTSQHAACSTQALYSGAGG